MQQKLSQEQTPVFDCLFNRNQQKRHLSVGPAVQQQHAHPPVSDGGRGKVPVYHVEKINKMKFKIYKQHGGQYVDRLPVTDLSFQIKIKGDHQQQTIQNAKPRLQEILSQYRKMNLSQKKPKSRGLQTRRVSGGYGSQMNVKMMRKTVYKMGGSMYRK